MALSGTYYTNVGSGYRLQLEWSATQDISANTSTITAKLYWMSLDSQYTISSSATKDGAITIDGTTSTFSGAGLASLSGNQKKLLHTYTKTVTHNADGTKSVSFSAYFDAEVTLGGTYYPRISIPQQTATLNTIPRESTLVSSPSWTAGNDLAISISRASSSFTHTVKIYVNNTLIKTITGVGTSATATFSTSENTAIFTQLAQTSSKQSKITLETYNGGNLVGSNDYFGTCSAPSASTITTSADFNIGDPVSVSISRSNSVFTHTLKFYTGNTLIKTITGVGTNTTWTPSQAEKDSMYNTTPNSNTVSSKIECITYYNGVQVQSLTSKTGTATVTNSNPIFGANFTYKDTNTTTKNITGNDQFIIQNNSTVVVEIPESAKATAINGATMASYVATLNGVSITQPYAGTGTVSFNFGTVNASSNLTLSIKAIDSRGNYTTATKTVNMVAYSPPSLTVSATRTNNFDNETILKVSGSFSLIDVSGVKNSIQTFQYRYKESTTGTWGGWLPLSYTTSGSTFNAIDVSINAPTGLDNTKAWNIEVQIVDKLSNVTTSKTVGAGQPILFIDAVKKSVGVNKFPVNNLFFEVSGNVDITGYANLNGTLYVKNGGVVSVANPNNASAFVYLSWLNDIPRIRYGGTGAGSSNGFQIQGQGDAVKFSVDNSGNGLFAGGLTVNNKITAIGSNDVLETGSASGAIIDQYGNIRPKNTVTSTAAWHLDDVLGNQVIKVYWGSSPSGVEIKPSGAPLKIIRNQANTQIIGTDHAYIEWYPLGTASGRKGWIGYGSAGTTDLTIQNASGNIKITPNNGSDSFVFIQQNPNASILFGQTRCKFLTDASQLQSRLPDDSGYGSMGASAFNVASRSEFKRNIKKMETPALDIINKTPIYNYQLESDFKIFDEYTGEVVALRNESEVKVRTGLIYEEAPEELISSDETIDIYAMCSLLWKAVQELSEQVDFLLKKVKKK